MVAGVVAGAGAVAVAGVVAGAGAVVVAGAGAGAGAGAVAVGRSVGRSVACCSTDTGTGGSPGNG